MTEQNNRESRDEPRCDITARLRARGGREGVDSDLLIEAAAEIDRLRDKLESALRLAGDIKYRRRARSRRLP